MIEYVPELQAELVNAGFNAQNIYNILDQDTIVRRASIIVESYLDRTIHQLIDQMTALNYNDGCIFPLSSGRRDGQCILYATRKTKEDIRRILSLKVFL